MSEKIKAIFGSNDRAEEVKKWLKDHGATNLENYVYDYIDRVYFVDRDNHVKFLSAEYSYLFDVVELPVKKPLLKVISGNKDRSMDVIKVLKNLGGINAGFFEGVLEDSYYYIDNKDGIIKSSKIDDDFFKEYELEILTLPKEQVVLKPFDKVLVRDRDNRPWKCDFFSHYNTDGNGYPYCCIKANWFQCIPYEGNEDKLNNK